MNTISKNTISKMPKRTKVILASVRAGISKRYVRQKDIVKLAGVHPQYVYDVLHGKRTLTDRMARVLRGVINDYIWPRVKSA